MGRSPSRLTLLHEEPNGFGFYRCLCGTEKSIRRQHVIHGRIRSCGCLKRQHNTSGWQRAFAKHGMHKSPEYRAWTGMIQRCYNPNHDSFHRYGGRGIEVCARWRHSFTEFFAYIGKRPSTRHSLDRFPDADGNYEPGNVRWATPAMQIRNRSITKLNETAVYLIRHLVRRGQRQEDIAHAFGIDSSTISRIARAMTWRNDSTPCSFCKAFPAEGRKMIVGHDAGICEDCIVLFADTLQRDVEFRTLKSCGACGHCARCQAEGPDAEQQC